jgi:RNA polymerase sigma factor (sigma-70 family)
MAMERLLAAYRTDGDTRARDRLVQLYLPLVESLADRYAGRRSERHDLVEVGSLGLVDAIDRFDPDGGDEFAAFAVPIIAGDMKRHTHSRTTTVSAEAERSGGLLLRMPPPLHDDLAAAAQRGGLSLNRFITGTLTRAVGVQNPGEGERSDPSLRAHEAPPWLPAAIVANIVVVVIAVLAALVLLVIAWQNGW